jgi:hypothetical protein
MLVPRNVELNLTSILEAGSYIIITTDHRKLYKINIIAHSAQLWNHYPPPPPPPTHTHHMHTCMQKNANSIAVVWAVTRTWQSQDACALFRH